MKNLKLILECILNVFCPNMTLWPARSKISKHKKPHPTEQGWGIKVLIRQLQKEQQCILASFVIH